MKQVRDRSNSNDSWLAESFEAKKGTNSAINYDQARNAVFLLLGLEIRQRIY